MALQPDKTKDQRDAASIASQARDLFEQWTAEEEAGYRGEVPWEEFKREINVAPAVKPGAYCFPNSRAS
jgi:hypothetical protein